MPRPRRQSRYGRFTGGPDPLAPPVDLSEALDAVSESVMAGYSPEAALREFLRRGAQGQEGLDDLAGRIQRRRRDLLSRHRLDGTLQEAARLLKQAILAERGQLARDTEMDPTDRALREMTIENLPAAPSAAITELADYDWASHEARETYRRIQELVGTELLEQRFAGMKQALSSATEADREAITQMLGDLGDLLEKHSRGEDTAAEFAELMRRHGEHFPEDPASVDELIDALAQRSAAARRMLNSMTPQQREELMALSQQAFGSPQLREQLDRLDSSLQALRPGMDWGGSEDFDGPEEMGLGEGAGVMQELAELDRLSEQLSQSYAGSSLSDLDIEALGRRLGRDAAVTAQTLRDLERSMQDSGFLRRHSEGDLRLSPAAMRKLGQGLLRDAASRLSTPQGVRDSGAAGAAGEQTGATRPWQFGDAEPWDVGRTVSNALTRTAAEGGGAPVPGGIRLRVEDIEVRETEARTRAAVALLVDTSFSMAIEGRWVPMKRTALALHHLISTRFRGDALQLVSFGRSAQSREIGDLMALDAVHEQGTNLHHGLMLAGQFFRRRPSMQPVLLVVTDGEPTARLLPGGESWFSYPPEQETLAETVAELDRISRAGARTTFFRLGDDPGLARFLQAMARRAGGEVVAPDLEDLGAAVVGEFLQSRTGASYEDLW
jgi:uncharacterized protein with von Willebrand factor type A (vWA) domain